VGESPNRLLWLDSLRGIAVLGVVLVHCGLLSQSSGFLGDVTAAGQYGVQLFFVVSAITISMTYQQHAKKYGTSPRSAFAWLIRRVYRIWPLYAIAAFLYSIEGFILNAYLGGTFAQKIGWFDIFANLIFIHTWIPSANNSVVPGGWSISVEVMFYCIFPILMIAQKRPHFRAIFIALAMFSLAMSELVNRLRFGTFAILNNSYFYFWLPTQIPVILIGCWFYFRVFDQNSFNSQINAWVLAVAFAALSACGLALGTWGHLSPGMSPSIFALAFCCLAVLASSGGLGLITGRWISQIGVCSYSIYLVHFAILHVARLALKLFAVDQSHPGILLLLLIYIPVAALSFYVATWTRRLVEVPGIEIGRRLSARLLSRSIPSTVSS
jgi:peptidoglycan/LPS O-acetylase OafA/YrhL